MDNEKKRVTWRSVYAAVYSLAISWLLALTLLRREKYSVSGSVTGYNQSVTVCGSQRRHVVVTQRKLMQTV